MALAAVVDAHQVRGVLAEAERQASEEVGALARASSRDSRRVLSRLELKRRIYRGRWAENNLGCSTQAACGCSQGGLVQAVFFDLVQEGFVADTQVFGGLLAVPVSVTQHL